jgi:hypothetical protein
MAGFNAALEQSQQDLGYQPQGTEYEALANIGKLLQPIAEPVGQAVDAVGESYPALGAALRAAPILAPFGGKAARAGNKILAEELARPSGVLSSQKGHFRLPVGIDETAEAQKAQSRLHRGDAPSEVWRETGWGQAPQTTEMLKEVSDSQFSIPSSMLYRGTVAEPDALVLGNKQSPTAAHLLQDVLTGGNDILDLIGRDTVISGDPKRSINSAQYMDPSVGHLGTKFPGDVTLGPMESYPKLLQSLSHELEHGAQYAQRRPGGGNPSEFGADKAAFDESTALRTINNLLTPELVRAWRPHLSPVGNDLLSKTFKRVPRTRVWIEELRKADPFTLSRKFPASPLEVADRLELELENMLSARRRGDQAYSDYKNLHGEAMARLTAERQAMGDVLRRAHYPFNENYFFEATGSRPSDLKIRYRP